MRLHGNAALSWQGRRRLAQLVVVDGWTVSAAADAAGVSVRCARKWVGRYRLEGEAGLFDRSSAPRRVANRTPTDRVAAIVALRQVRMTSAEIAELLGVALSTVSGILKRQGMGRLGRIGLEQPVRYEYQRPGELVHLDIKKLGRIHGGAGKRVTGGIKRNPGVPHRYRRQAAQDGRLGLRPYRDRRLQPLRLRRGPRRREGLHRDRLPPPGDRPLPTPRHPGRASSSRWTAKPSGSARFSSQACRTRSGSFCSGRSFSPRMCTPSRTSTRAAARSTSSGRDSGQRSRRRTSRTNRSS